VSESAVVHFAYSDSQKVEPIHRWGKGYVVSDAASSAGRTGVEVDRAQLVARAQQRRRKVAAKRSKPQGK
jgi:hypothetical protein